MSQPNHDEREDRRPIADELTPVEQVLAEVAPRPVQLDRDRLMFLAGQASALASGGRHEKASGARQPTESGSDPARDQGTGKLSLPARLLWPAATAALAATSLALAVALVLRPAPRVEFVYIERPLEPQPAARQAAAQAARPAASNHAADDRPSNIPSRIRSGSIPANNYVRTRDVALRLGLDALGMPRGLGGGEAAPTYNGWRQNLLGEKDDFADPLSYLSPNL
jgi:hypothetical protein